MALHQEPSHGLIDKNKFQVKSEEGVLEPKIADTRSSY